MCRFYYAGQDFTDRVYGEDADNTYFGRDKPALAEKNACINLPYVIDGDLVLTQSNSILLFLGKKLGINKDEFFFHNHQVRGVGLGCGAQDAHIACCSPLFRLPLSRPPLPRFRLSAGFQPAPSPYCTCPHPPSSSLPTVDALRPPAPGTPPLPTGIQALDQAMDWRNDTMQIVYPIAAVKTKDDFPAALRSHMDACAATHLRKLQGFCVGPFMCGPVPQSADFHVFELVEHHIAMCEEQVSNCLRLSLGQD